MKHHCPILLIPVVLGIVTTASLSAAEGFHWDEPNSGEYRLQLGNSPVITCMTAYDASTPERREETYKVYTHVYGPKSGDLITKGPGGKYPHHRGIYLGWNKTIVGDQSYDFWHCPPKTGVHQRLSGKPETHADSRTASISMKIDWNDGEGNQVIREIRTLRVEATDAPNSGWMIDVRSELSSQRGEIRLEGDRQHAGLQFRATQEVADKDSARYVRPSGFPQEPEAHEVDDSGIPPRHIDLGWLAMNFESQGKRYSVEYFADPSLPRPALYSERPYGRFGSFFKTVLQPDTHLVLRYRFLVSEGVPDLQENIQKRYEAFTAELN